MDVEAEASDNGGRTPSQMEQLPDELLVMILSRVQDAASLLDCVPLVCRRWRRLSRACWADADLRLPYFDAGSGRLRVRKKHARLLLHAPPAGRLRLTLKLVGGATSNCVRLTTALRRCTAGISELFLEHVEPPWEGNYYEAACKRILLLIKSNGHHLKKFSLKVKDIIQWSESLAELGLWPGLPRTLLHCSALRSLRCPANCVSALRAMPGLAELELDFAEQFRDEEGMPRPKEPWPTAASLPALRSLAFNHCERNEDGNLYPWAGELMVTLCRAAPGLTRLYAACPGPFDRDWCTCAAEQLRLDEALAGLPRLRSVCLRGEPAILASLTNQPLDALVDIELGIDCDDYEDFKRDVETLKAARRRARVAVDLHVRGPTTMRFEWPGPD